MSLPVRTRAGVALGALAGRLSRVLGRGAGATLPGRVTLAVAPDALSDLAAGRRSVMITGTNGKTTTTAFLVAALGADPAPGAGAVVTNLTGANLPTGVVAALSTASAAAAPRAVLETDELHVPAVMRAVRPEVLVLLNLSRDQLDRTHEVRRAVTLWRDAIAAAGPGLTVVANAADPNIAHAAAEGATTGGATVRWVDGGMRWFGDSELCPRCDALLDARTADAHWSCAACGLTQPNAQWVLAGRTLHHDGGSVDLDVALPGEANLSNAAFALAAADAFGAPVAEAAPRLAAVADVAGRYASRPFGRSARPARMLLAKNPAGWTVSLDLIGPDDVVVLGVNARTQDGTDTSWLWDVPFERLAGRTVGVLGERVADLELRLVHAGVRTVRAPRSNTTGGSVGTGSNDPVADADALADALPAGPLTVLATYTTFQELRRG